MQSPGNHAFKSRWWPPSLSKEGGQASWWANIWGAVLAGEGLEHRPTIHCGWWPKPEVLLSRLQKVDYNFEGESRRFCKVTRLS